MKYVLTLEYTTLAGLQEAVKLLEGNPVKLEAVKSEHKAEVGNAHSPTEAVAKRGRGRPPKASAQATDGAGPTFEEAITPEPLDEPTPAEVEAPKAPLTFETDIIPAFQAYAKRNSRDAAIAILTSYKVKSVREIPPQYFHEVMEKLS